MRKKAEKKSWNKFDHPGPDEWIRNNWPQAFASGVTTNLQVSEDPTNAIVAVLAVIGFFVGEFLLLGGKGDWKKNENGTWRKEW